MNARVSRRALLGAGIATAAVGLVGCNAGGEQEAEERSEKNRAVVLPTYQAVELVKPDLPGTDVVMPGYFSYPRGTTKVFDKPPGEGLGELSIMYPTYLPVPTGPESNSFWAQLQTDVGATLNLQPIPSGDYTPKFQTMIAGGDLPDVLMFPQPTPDQPKVFEKLFADLGPLLSGDAVKEFPYLANIPTVSWPTAISNGTIYAIPQPRAITGQSLFYRPDLLEQAGADPEPKDYDEFVGLFEAVTNRDKDRFAFSGVGAIHLRILSMMGGPNVWSESGGTFTTAYSDPTYRESLALMPELVKKYAHPESATVPYNQHREFFYAGSTAFLTDGYAGWELYVRGLGSADKLALMVAPKAEGGGDGAQFTSRSYQSITAINKKVPGDRLRSVLNVLNFLAAPIGSAEHLRRKFGVEGTDHTWEGAAPVLTDQGRKSFMDYQYIVDAPTILGPGPQSEVETQHTWMDRVSKVLVADPSMGLYSDTANLKSSSINRPLNDVIGGVFYGRNSLDDFDAALKKWKADGGDTIAEELGQAFAANS